ncbi:heterocyst frequency control protein PatD [Oscillatoria sp. FACHB-1407]|uniref:heterocyst frequency control protein PatD n=1 Tax=Oscillatoria sp. FACHB-1407 TaxID=2692847 RepID=UPI001689ED27|nr:heterocyst frequency control protein PatD [Oscillatoria sp. FACHB-1407]MBD2465046.1 heterocyst frequency control protein PatD [Oscillatoria sp. FACHB-1407]
MLPVLYRQSYEALQQTLQQLQASITVENPDLKGFRAMLQTAKTQFQQQILTLDPEQLEEEDSAIALRLQSIQTEISKQLRLLDMDLLFLQTARQPATVQQRYVQIGDRLTTLIRYCEVVLGDEEEGDEGMG